MPYMTILHWIGVVFFILLFFILSLLAMKEKSPKIRNSMIFSAFILSLFGAVISIFVLDKYTKKAKILSYSQKRVLSTEKIQFSGRVQNIGNFKIKECAITVKLSNNAMKMGRPKNAFFKPSSSLGMLFSDKKDEKPSVIKEDFIVATNLKPKQIKNFRINMNYPPHMNAPGLKLTINCH
jgi:hypothetical protein